VIIVELRLADLLASLSLVSDLGMGNSPEQAMEACLIATELAGRMNLSTAELSDVYYTTLLLHVGCTAYAHEVALLFGGDDIAFRRTSLSVDFGNARETLTDFVFQIAKGSSPLTRARSVGVLLTRGASIGLEASRATCEVAAQMARRMGMPPTVQQALSDMFERWDGKGDPRRLKGDDIAQALRFAQVAAQAALFNRIGDAELACDVIRRRAGTALDPVIAASFVKSAPELLKEVVSDDVWEAVLAAEPRPQRLVSHTELDQLARAFADAVDLKSPFMHGHSVGVAELAMAAAGVLGLGEAAALTLRHAGMFHDLGRVGVPNGIWEKPGALSVSEWEQVRLHPYHSERILARSPALAEIATLAGMHHERQDGSGYYRRISAPMIPMPARILAAADTYQAMTQLRPYRPAFSPEAAAAKLAGEGKSGRLDGEAIGAVLVAAGQRTAAPRPSRPAGLTEREVEVLNLIAQGCSNREMAQRLSISPKTAGHHVQHIYDKIGVSTRAAAAMFAMEHDLLRQ
jgi:HD-GYP domain-containing protein (c-di-GMP phosphodiesterase class II)